MQTISEFEKEIELLQTQKIDVEKLVQLQKREMRGSGTGWRWPCGADRAPHGAGPAGQPVLGPRLDGQWAVRGDGGCRVPGWEPERRREEGLCASGRRSPAFPSRKDVRGQQAASGELRRGGRQEQVTTFTTHTAARPVAAAARRSLLPCLSSRLSEEDLGRLNEDGELWFAYEGLKKATR